MDINQLYEDIRHICDATPKVRSDRQRKDNIYRGIKARLEYYRQQIQSMNRDSLSFSRFENVSDEEYFIFVVNAISVKNDISNRMTSDEYVKFILDTVVHFMDIK